MRILGVEQAKAEAVSHNGSHWGLWDIEYEAGGSKPKVFRISCGLTASGKFFLSCKTKDRDKVVAALRASPLFLRIRMDIASGMLLQLVQELGDDAVKQAFEEAIVKSVAEA